MHRITAASQETGALEAGRSRADDEERVVARTGRDVLGVPSLTPFLPHGRVLRTPNRRHGVVARNAHIATDTFPYVVDIARVDLIWQKWIGYGRARGADEIKDSAPNLRDHGIGGRESAHADYRLRGDLLDETYELFLKAFRGKSRCSRVVGPVAQIHVPKIGELTQHFDDFATLTGCTEAISSP